MSSLKVLIISFFAFFSVAAFANDPIDPFPLSPAPLWENIEGTWVTDHERNPMYFKFCRLKKGPEGQLRIQMARSLSSEENSRVLYHSIGNGDSLNRSVNFFVSDLRLNQGNRAKVRVRSYYADDFTADVVLRLEVMSLVNPESSINEFMMTKVSSERPGHCQ